ncbi:hypothetical protein K2173_028165 [Erythroxylum novogranatense]|uniref:Myosin heavy chain n=1 Tax=Erythroxylum novogranatense TaxID=1862640 RepID=A0AAV8U3R8_9ROSI|nr:hypothetical protein K2173_028165 [Erythroxylum novogranatense]
MGEIDARPIERVQVVVTHFGEQGEDQKKYQHTRHTSGSSSEGMDKEKDAENLQRELANLKVQLEAKDSAYLQLQLNLENHQKTAEELCTQRKNSERERDACIEELTGARYRICELESKVHEMDDQFLEAEKIREQLSYVLCELKSTQGEMMRMESELAAAKDEKLMALTKAEVMESAAAIEKDRAQDLLNHIAELNETIFMSKRAIIEAVKDKAATLSKKDVEVELATERAAQSEKQMEEMRKQVEDLEKQLLEKSLSIDSLQMEFNQSNGKVSSLDKGVYGEINDLNQLKADLTSKEEENSEQTFHIEALETELNRLKSELKNANDEASTFNHEIEMLTTELKKVKAEMSQIKERENEAQVEIALLKSKLHRRGTKLAASRAGVERVDENHGSITISLDEYKYLIRKVEKVDQSRGQDQVETLKKELHAAVTKIMELRTRAEQAVTRADAAEEAKVSLEDQLKRWREQKKRRKAALAALREESSSRESCIVTYDSSPKKYLPLGEFLNIKF